MERFFLTTGQIFLISRLFQCFLFGKGKDRDSLFLKNSADKFLNKLANLTAWN